MSTTWANLCRKANGEKLVSFNGTLMTPRQTALQRKTFRLLHLPWDIRHTFYQTLFPKTTFAFFLPGTNGLPRIGVPFHTITTANKQIRLESLLVALEQTEIEIHSGPGNAAFQTWLAAIEFSPLHGDVSPNISSGFDAVQRLSFPFFSRFPHRYLPAGTPNSDVELMRKCPKLKELRLNFVVQELWMHGVEKGVVQLRDEYRLDGILGLEKLRRLVLVGPVGEDEDVGVKSLAKWFGEESESVGRKVVVVSG